MSVYRDRTGELIEVDDQAETHDRAACPGLLGDDDQPMACPVCRPHVERNRRELRRRLEWDVR